MRPVQPGYQPLRYNGHPCVTTTPLRYNSQASTAPATTELKRPAHS